VIPPKALQVPKIRSTSAFVKEKAPAALIRAAGAFYRLAQRV